MHPSSIIVAIDAAIGNADDVGLIRVLNKGLKPGLGVDKNLGTVGDNSIIGVVAGKSLQNYNLFNMTRLNLIYKMAEQISNGIEKYLLYLTENLSLISQNSFGA
jgi:putative sporulation protein YyaC